MGTGRVQHRVWFRMKLLLGLELGLAFRLRVSFRFIIWVMVPYGVGEVEGWFIRSVSIRVKVNVRCMVRIWLQ